MILRFPEFSRDMRRGEEGAVDALLRRAFDGAREVQLVAALRRADDIAGEVVLPFQGGIVGYYALSRMRAPEGWLCVAVVAIDPDWQSSGHGRRLIGVLGEWARLSGRHVVATGPAGFFERAGFIPASMDGTDVLLAGPGWNSDDTSLIYPAAFETR